MAAIYWDKNSYTLTMQQMDGDRWYTYHRRSANPIVKTTLIERFAKNVAGLCYILVPNEPEPPKYDDAYSKQDEIIDTLCQPIHLPCLDEENAIKSLSDKSFLSKSKVVTLVGPDERRLA